MPYRPSPGFVADLPVYALQPAFEDLQGHGANSVRASLSGVAMLGELLRQRASTALPNVSDITILLHRRSPYSLDPSPGFDELDLNEAVTPVNNLGAAAVHTAVTKGQLLQERPGNGIIEVSYADLEFPGRSQTCSLTGNVVRAILDRRAKLGPAEPAGLERWLRRQGQEHAPRLFGPSADRQQELVEAAASLYPYALEVHRTFRYQGQW